MKFLWAKDEIFFFENPFLSIIFTFKLSRLITVSLAPTLLMITLSGMSVQLSRQHFSQFSTM